MTRSANLYSTLGSFLMPRQIPILVLSPRGLRYQTEIPQSHDDKENIASKKSAVQNHTHIIS